MYENLTNKALVFEGWCPVINGEKLPELFHDRKEAIGRGKQIVKMLNEKGACIGAVFERHEVRYEDVSKYVSKEDFDEALRCTKT